MARRPGAFVLVAIVVALLAGVGFVRYTVAAGPELLVGQSSDAKQVYDRFAGQFGADPIVVVMAARNPTAFYIERNLLRLGALESDLAKDPRVAAVLGPGTIAGSAEVAAEGEVSKVLNEYPFFVGETALATAINRGEKDNGNLSKIEQDAYNAAQLALIGSVVKATQDADAARDAFTKQAAATRSTDAPLFLRQREQAAEKAASNTAPPPLFAQYLAGPSGTADQAAAQALFDRLTAGFGDCSSAVASVLHINASCQVFLERLLLDLPSCPATAAAGSFCPPKSQWAAVLPKPVPSRGFDDAVITLRLKPEVVGHADQVNGLLQKLRDELLVGRPHDPQPVVQQLKGLLPRECGGLTSADTTTVCYQHYHDDPVDVTVAGAPLLVQGVVGTMTHLLLALFPIALLVMLLLLVGTFRVSGRLWPLVAAAGAALLTIGGGLLVGVPITPAVLAGVPVLLGLGVDYAVQMVARFTEERRRGVGIEAALRLTLGNTGPATLIAAVATLAGLAVLAGLTGLDVGPLAAVPLIAEFALVLCAGVAFAWLAALFIAVPAAAWTARRRAADLGRFAEEPGATEPPAPDAPRTRWLAERWGGVVVPAALLALLGWVLLPRVPIETSVERLLAPGLTEVRDIDAVRAQLGYDNELDFAVLGSISGSDPKAAVPDPVTWMAFAGGRSRCDHPHDIALATTIGDVFTAQSGTGPTCQQLEQGPTPPPVPSPAPAPGVPSPAPSGSVAPSPSAAPSGSSSPSALRGAVPSPGIRDDGDVVRVGNLLAATTAPAAAPTPAASAPAPATSPTPAPTSSISNPAASGTLQTAFLCDLRLLAPLARNLVGDIPLGTQACPARDLYRNVFLSNDTTPINPRLARIALGVQIISVADQAKLIDELQSEYQASLTAFFGSSPPLKVAPTGLNALAASAYRTLSGRVLWFNLVPLVLVGLVLLLVYRGLRRALLPLLPSALAAGWSPLVVLLLGRIPGDSGGLLGTFNPLTVVLGALVIALGTEFGVVLLQRFYEERTAGADPDLAAATALRGVGRAIAVSALTLGAGFAVLAVSGLFPGGLPLIADFGLAVVIDLALAVGAVFLVMLPAAVALERMRPLVVAAPAAAPSGFQRPRARGAATGGAGQRARAAERRPAAPQLEEEEPHAATAASPRTSMSDPAQASETPSSRAPMGEGSARPRASAPAPAQPPVAAEPAQPSEISSSRAGEISSPPRASAPQSAQPPVAAGPAPRPSWVPGVSGRRRPPEHRLPTPSAAPSAPVAPRLPGMSGRRRASAAPTPPVAPDVPQTPAPEPAVVQPVRRMPGGVTRRRPTDAAPPAPPQPPPPQPAAPAATAPAPAPQQPGARRPATPERPPHDPPRGPRSKRRRPPPWVRRQDGGGEGGTPPQR
jgi:predicted RND superfamily exporter protein